jgi:hypothetical protein
MARLVVKGSDDKKYGRADEKRRQSKTKRTPVKKEGAPRTRAQEKKAMASSSRSEKKPALKMKKTIRPIKREKKELVRELKMKKTIRPMSDTRGKENTRKTPLKAGTYPKQGEGKEAFRQKMKEERDKGTTLKTQKTGKNKGRSVGYAKTADTYDKATAKRVAEKMIDRSKKGY